MQGELLKDELDRMGMSQRKLCALTGMNEASLSRMLGVKDKWKLDDMARIGPVLEQYGGNPANIWPEYYSILKRPQPPGLPFYENHLDGTPDRSIHIPGFEDCSLFLRSFDPAIEPMFRKGDILALRKSAVIVAGGLYYLRPLDTFRKVRQSKDLLVLESINPDYPVMEIKAGAVKVMYEIKGMIRRF